MIHKRLNFLRLRYFPHGWLVESLAFESTGFRSQLRDSSLSSHTEEFWLIETDLSVDDNIYIYRVIEK